MNNPKISLIIIYNNQENLPECVTSAINQTFSDIEIICINNGASDNSEEVVKEYALKDERIKLISLPINNDIETAKKIGLGTASGEFVCVIDNPEVLNPDYIKNLYLSTNSKTQTQIKSNHLYRRSFLENDIEISQLIEDKVKFALEESLKEINTCKEAFQNQYNNFSKSNIETINNSNYEILQRFNQLEKLFYQKDYEYKQIIDENIKNLYQDIDNKTKKIYEDISKIYEFINSEINKKGTEINKVYEEITKNYEYTEHLISDKINEINKNQTTSIQTAANKINELEKEIITRYVNLKRLMDMKFDETDLKLKALNPSDLNCFKNAVDNITIEKTISDNMEKMYSQINKTSSLFYEELTKMYKELNEKLIRIQDK